MSAILIITVFLIVAAALVTLRTKRTKSNEEAEQLPHGVTPRGLFGAYGADGDCTTGRLLAERELADETAKALLERASAGDFAALREAHEAGDAALYGRVLDALVADWAKGEEDLSALADFVAGSDDLRATPALAGRLLEVFERSPGRASSARLLRVAALSDDAAAFERAAEAILGAWERGRLGGLTGEELRPLFDGEYWLLSSEAKRSGAGFLLKQKLADVRRRLSETARRDAPHTNPARGDAGRTQKERL